MKVGQAVVARRGLDSLASRINAAHEAFENSARLMFSYAAEAGELLLNAKEQVEHGEWLPWLKGNFSWSIRLAENYMRLAKGSQEIAANSQRVANLSLRGALKLLEKPKKKAAKKAAKSAVPSDLPAVTERYELIRADLASVNGEVPKESNDWIITDPPYPKEYLPVYDALGSFAARTLKPGGSLLAMVGQSYLPEILAILSNHLAYHWTLAYLTPGGQAVQLWDRNVNTFWKPVLWFVKGEYAGDWIGDVCKSDVNDNDKKHHDWGQSESGMADIIDRFTYPGQTICDPFLGGGTTGVVAVKMNRRFVGIDISEDAIETTKRRLAEVGA